jgi:hypothetical protein
MFINLSTYKKKLSKTTTKVEQNYNKIGAKLDQNWSKTRPTVWLHLF